MLTPLHIAFGIVALAIVIVGAAILIRKKIRERRLAMDIAHVEYKGALIPIRRAHRGQWYNMSGSQKREHWLSLQRAIKKGKLIKTMVDGKPMYLATKKGAQERANAEEYEKMIKNL